MSGINPIPEASLEGRCKAHGYNYGSLRAEVMRGALPFLHRHRGIKRSILSADEIEALELYFRLDALAFKRKAADRLACRFHAALMVERDGPWSKCVKAAGISLMQDAGTMAIDLGGAVMIIERKQLKAA